MDEGQQLENVLRRQKANRLDRAVRLGETVKQLLERRIAPQQRRLGPVLESWRAMLPEELNRHCRITGLSSGQLEVKVDSPSYMYELRLCSSQLLETLERHCPGARISRIKFSIGKVS